MGQPPTPYNDEMMFGVVRQPSKRLSRPQVRCKFLRQQLLLLPPDDARRAQIEQSLRAVEAELQRSQHVCWTERDDAILQTVATLRYATVEQVQASFATDAKLSRFATSRRGIANRMKLQYAHAWLDRPPLQRSLLYEDNAPLIYTVGPAGLRRLAELDAGKQRIGKRNAVPLTLAHELEINDAVLAFRAAVQSEGLSFRDQHELSVPVVERGLRTSHAFGCKVGVKLPQLNQPLQLTAIPDRAFAVIHADEARHTFLLEWDRQSMSVGDSRTRLIGKSSFIKKLYAYHAIWQQQLHESRWGVRRWRLLTITRSEARIASMLKAQAIVTGGRLSGLFLYTTVERIAREGVLGPVWISAARDHIALLDRED